MYAMLMKIFSAKISRCFSFALLTTFFGLMTGPFTFHAGAANEAIRIGVVDMQKALQSVEAGKAAKDKLEKEVETKKKDIQTEQTALQKLEAELEKQTLVLSDEAKAKKQRDLQERFMKFNQMAYRTQEELKKREMDLTKPILEKLRKLISDMAKNKGYTIILEKNENTILFSLDKDDLTGEIIVAFNK